MAAPRPKFGEKGHEGESGTAYGKRVRDWNKAKEGGRQVAPDYKPSATGAEPAPAGPLRRRSNETDLEWQTRQTKHNRAQGQGQALRARRKKG